MKTEKCGFQNFSVLVYVSHFCTAVFVVFVLPSGVIKKEEEYLGNDSDYV